MADRKRKKRKKPKPKQETVKSLMGSGLYSEAADLLRKQLKAEHSEEKSRLLAECMVAIDDYPGALAAMGALKARTPGDVLYEGWILLQAEDIEKARDRFTKYISLQPASARGYYWLARTFAYWRIHDDVSKEAVLDNLRKALSCQDCPAEAYMLLAQRLPWHEGGCLEKLSVLKQGLAKCSDSDELRLDLSGLYIRHLEMPREGLDVLQPLLKREQPPSCALWRALDACRRLRAFTEAVKYLDLIPDEHIDPVARGFVTGDLYSLAADHSKALKAFSTSITEAKLQDRILLLFGRAATFLHMEQAGPAIDDAKNAVFSLLDFESEPWTEPFWVNGEPEGYNTIGPIRYVCDALLVEDDTFIRQSVDQQLRGALLYCRYLISDQDGEATDDSLDEAARLLDHPAISLRMADRKYTERRFAEGLQHHLNYCRWRYRRACGNPVEVETLRDIEAQVYLGEAQWPTTKKDCRSIIRVFCSALAECVCSEEVQAVFVPTYISFVRECLRRKDMYAELGKPANMLLEHDRSNDDVLWDWAYANHCDKKHNVAEAAYRELLEMCPENSSALHNLSLILAAEGDKEEAFALSEKAAALAPENENITKRFTGLKDQQVEEERERERREDFLKTAVQRWPKLDHYKRQLLCTISLISGWQSMEHLSRLSGIDEQWVERHLGVLEKEGMLLYPSRGKFEVNPYILPLLERENTHAVVTKLIHGDDSIAFKPIFNSKQEYTVYNVLISLFPNHIVFPNMALQTVFQYERMRELLDKDEFGFFLRSQVDFCVTSTANYLPLIAFEVDSRFHDKEDQKARDAKKDRIFEVGGVPLLRLRGHGRPTATAMRNQIISEVTSLGDSIRQLSEKSAVLASLEREIDFNCFGAEEGSGAGPRWLTVRQAASVSGANPGVVSRAVDSGELMGNGMTEKERRIDAVSLAQWILHRSNRPEVGESDAEVERLVRKHVKD